MFKVNFNKRILGGFLLSLGIITWLAINSFVNTGKLISTNQWVAHRHEVLYRSQNILAVAVDIEIGQRGFSLTGNEKSLEPYYKASKEIKSLLKDLSMLSADNPSQGQRISEMEIYVNKLLNFSASVIEARRKSFEDAR